MKVRPDATNKELAAAGGVHERTISNWKNTDEWREALSMLPEAILKDSFFLKAVNGDTQAFAKWMAFFGKEQKPEEDDFARALNMTEDDYRKACQQIHAYYEEVMVGA